MVPFLGSSTRSGYSRYEEIMSFVSAVLLAIKLAP
jgi:hypothetical protein